MTSAVHNPEKRPFGTEDPVTLASIKAERQKFWDQLDQLSAETPGYLASCDPVTQDPLTQQVFPLALGGSIEKAYKPWQVIASHSRPLANGQQRRR
ncbi:hypothetical protein QTJ16_001140 [Diplocarpon rosae]|uniref:Uncharacterized protein n=1 Tax=Diplocarpon rosae TaxID=946125 RepID=A0AAD9T871_9HELO|nr:hypothetical protein QTJ16_001140 [Diplocarpon rosae]